jgi:hypothetical protein
MTAIERSGAWCGSSWRIRGGLVLTALAVFLGGCCGAHPDPIYIFELYLDAFDWTSEVDTSSGVDGVPPVIRVRFGDRGVTFRETELLEIYAPDGTARIPITGAVMRDFVDDVTCPADVVDYDISTLAPGTYLMVHRRSSAPEGFDAYLGEADWTTFEGEDALVTTLVVSPR